MMNTDIFDKTNGDELFRIISNEAFMSWKQAQSEEDKLRAKAILLACVQKESPDAMYMLAVICLMEGNTGDGAVLLKGAARKGHRQAFAYLLRSAEGGDMDSQLFIGTFYADAGNYSEAEKYLRPAADSGLEQAQAILGVVLVSQEKYREVERYLRPAADSGDADAQFYLGFAYANLGELRLEEKYLKMASAQGHERARILLDSLNSFLRRRKK